MKKEKNCVIDASVSDVESSIESLSDKPEEERELTPEQRIELLQERCDMLNTQLNGYKREYKRILNSGSVKTIFRIKKLVGRPYVPQYLETPSAKKTSASERLMVDELPTVTVVIPTYKPCDTIAKTVESVLIQDYDEGKIHVLLAVNAGNSAWAQTLRETYENDPRVRVAFTEKKGLSVARNFTRPLLDTDFVTYLDDDDYFTAGYLREMGCHALENVDVICGRMTDLHMDGSVDEDTYIVRAMEQVGEGLHEDYLPLGSLFSSFCAKLYRRELITEVFGDFDESLTHTEDIVYWVENIYKMKGCTYVCDFGSNESYVRRLTENSMSRPEEHEKQFAFYISDRIRLLERYATGIFEDRPISYKRFVLNKINSTVSMMRGYFKDLPEAEKERARELIFASECPFLNKAYFARKTGIAFCHNFSPFADASSYVASKRLVEIDAFLGEPIGWNVYCADMSRQRTKDVYWDMFYASYRYKEKKIVKIPTYFNEKSQEQWGKFVYHETKNLPADVIYSRSMWAGSHVAAYLYKKKHPEAEWFAEFSDPVYMDTNDTPRPVSKYYRGIYRRLNDFWKNVEQSVFQNADHVIFTNPSQLEYMMQSNPPKEEAAVRAKSIVWSHPRTQNCYANILHSADELDPSKINVGYFGTFYANRGIDPMLALLRNPQVELHVFTNVTDEHKVLAKKYPGLRFHGLVSHLEFLNLASRMDYCFLNDIVFEGKINPYIPSKLADYLAADSRVIVVTREGTELDRYEDPRLLKVPEITAAFTTTLTKKEG